MLIPYADDKSKSKIRLISFGGLNRGSKIGESELSEMKNMTSDYYPALAPRQKRALYKSIDNILCLSDSGFGAYFSREDGKNMFYYCVDTTNDIWEKTQMYIATSCKQIVKCNKYFIFFPQKIAYDTISKKEINLNSEYNAVSSITICDSDGYEIPSLTSKISNTAPITPVDGDYWVDSHDNKNHILKRYSSTYSGWFEYSPIIWIGVPGSPTTIKSFLSLQLRTGDKVRIEGTYLDSEIIASNLYEIIDTGIDWIKISAKTSIMTSEILLATSVKIKRNVPDMDFVIEYNNRLWGCSSIENEIYSSELGNPLSWQYYGIDSLASYALKVGTNGSFTGITAYGGYIIFFKEHCVHKLYGSDPSTYSVSVDEIEGVEIGSEKSLTNIGGILYYKGIDGVYAYGGTVPSLISEKLGKTSFSFASAGEENEKYYIAMTNSKTQKEELYVYDTSKYSWCLEDNLFCGSKIIKIIDKLMIYSSPQLFLISPKDKKASYEMLVPWSVTTSELFADDYSKNKIQRINVRILACERVEIKIDIEYDSCGFFQNVKNSVIEKTGNIVFSLIPQKFSSIKIKISGNGECKIYGLAVVTTKGGGN